MDKTKLHPKNRDLFLTAEDVLNMGDIGRWELIRGELIRMPPTGGEHGTRESRITQLLENYLDEHDIGRSFCGETGFYLTRNPDTVRGTDVMFYSYERLPLDTPIEGFLEIPPDLAVEIMSPNDTWNEVEAKVKDYLRVGVRLVWVVNPKQKTVSVHPEGIVLYEDDTLSGGNVLPGFSYPVWRLFRRKK